MGAPQIRNRGTVAGNLITASPANDTITPLMALDASVTLLSIRGERTIPLKEFYTGVRKTVMQADEMLVDISFPALTKPQRGTFIKLALRRAQAISVVNVAIILNLKADTVKSAVITLGAVTPTIIHAEAAEKFLAKKKLNDEEYRPGRELGHASRHPIDDIRGSAAYRREMVRVITARGLKSILNETVNRRDAEETHHVVGQETEAEGSRRQVNVATVSIQTTINGKEIFLQQRIRENTAAPAARRRLLTAQKKAAPKVNAGRVRSFWMARR